MKAWLLDWLELHWNWFDQFNLLPRQQISTRQPHLVCFNIQPNDSIIQPRQPIHKSVHLAGGITARVTREHVNVWKRKRWEQEKRCPKKTAHQRKGTQQHEHHRRCAHNWDPWNQSSYWDSNFENILKLWKIQLERTCSNEGSQNCFRQISNSWRHCKPKYKSYSTILVNTIDTYTTNIDAVRGSGVVHPQGAQEQRNKAQHDTQKNGQVVPACRKSRIFRAFHILFLREFIFSLYATVW